MVEQSKPDIIFLDFDRTLATTRGGGSPLQGTHSVDTDLAGMIATHPNVHIVTRNSNKADIAAFLKQEQVAVKHIHSVKKEGKSKSDVICDESLLPIGKHGIFVDDDITEHADHRLMAHANLTRVLFVRGF